MTTPGAESAPRPHLPGREEHHGANVQLDLFQGTHLTPEALKWNPYRGLPVLELDDGTCIAESVGDLSVFRGALSRPAADGSRTLSTRAVVAMWNRRMSGTARRDLAAPAVRACRPV